MACVHDLYPHSFTRSLSVARPPSFSSVEKMELLALVEAHFYRNLKITGEKKKKKLYRGGRKGNRLKIIHRAIRTKKTEKINFETENPLVLEDSTEEEENKTILTF